MPTVPTPRDNVVQGPQPKIDPTALAMAKAMMIEEGKADIVEQAVTWMTGRTRANRAFYNETRAGLLNPNAPPDEASPMGGLGRSLKSRRQEQMMEAERIDALFFPGNK